LAQRFFSTSPFNNDASSSMDPGETHYTPKKQVGPDEEEKKRAPSPRSAEIIRMPGHLTTMIRSMARQSGHGRRAPPGGRQGTHHPDLPPIHPPNVPWNVADGAGYVPRPGRPAPKTCTWTCTWTLETWTEIPLERPPDPDSDSAAGNSIEWAPAITLRQRPKCRVKRLALARRLRCEPRACRTFDIPGPTRRPDLSVVSPGADELPAAHCTLATPRKVVAIGIGRHYDLQSRPFAGSRGSQMRARKDWP
jgi:hypothetical protein